MLNVFYYVRKHTSLSRHFDSWFIFYFNLGRCPYSEYTQSTVVGHLISYNEITLKFTENEFLVMK